ncbi:disintegrin and metalloproteinase domain-containing protein 30 [Oryctolagus cuniculus]|nr:disintegrin and metalloproteinase domain-containing protein 30 [Oryctolagus cuniculus]
MRWPGRAPAGKAGGTSPARVRSPRAGAPAPPAAAHGGVSREAAVARATPGWSTEASPEQTMRSAPTLLSRGRSLPVLVLATLLIDSLGDDLIFLPEWGFDSYEITIPKKLSFRAGKQGAASPLSYLLRLKGKKHVLHLRPKQLLIPPHLRVFSFTEVGELVEDQPYMPRDCAYLGSVEESEDSDATLITCMGGLRGVLNIDAQQYQMEPLKDAHHFEHVVYLLKREPSSNQTCGLTDDVVEQQMRRHRPKDALRDYSESYKHQKYLELVMVFDQGRYKFVNSNLSQVISDAILLTAIMDTYFQEINVRITLKALEVWTDFNKVYLDYPTLSEVLSRFLVYRRTDLYPRLPSDWTHLYVHRKYSDALAWSWGKVCSKIGAGSVSTFLDENVLGPATWTTHEVGHALGMQHDEEYCQCKGRRSCIMGTGRTGFSNCSYIFYIKFISLGANCLNNIPGLGYVIKRCGNKILEDHEECDCGSKEECRKDLCCEPNCKLKHGANCSIGLCCHACGFRPSGYVCRQEENECDLAEYCNGTSSFCPNDTYKQDGTPCKYHGLCFRKGCRSRFMQCQSIFGPDAKEAPDQCYEAVNLQGNQYGNCAIIGVSSYRKCDKENSICGRLQCINVKSIPDLPEHTTIISTYLQQENLMCWGTGYHLSMEPLGIPDLGVINDGTSCGEDRVCINRTCVNSSTLKFDCLPEKCNGRGVCNNNKNCHCMYGWAPPFCEEMGNGGSIDSGSPRRTRSDVSAPVEVVSLMMLRVILFAGSLVAVFFRQVIIKCFTPNLETPISKKHKGKKIRKSTKKETK